MTSRAFFTVFCVLLFSQPLFAEQRPNVLFIISDDLTASALSCYGNSDCKTPNIDRLAARGVRFTHAYCQLPVCGPSRAALMSGLYCQQIGVTGNGSSDRFTDTLGDRPSMSQHFIKHGYYAARVSKIYHMRVPGDITAGADGPDHKASWTQRFNCKAPEQWTKGQHAHLSGEQLKPDPQRNIHYGLGYGGAFYVVRASDEAARQPDALAGDKAIKLMKKHKDESFFLAVGLVRAHVPLVAPAAYFDQYPPKRMTLAESVENDQADIPSAGLGGSTRARKIKEPWHVLSAYYAAIAFMDAQVGRMLETVDELGLADNMIVVFCADHGYHLGEHDLWQKMSLHEESARIPLIIAAPGYKRAVRDALAEQIDIYPTLADLAGLKIPAHVSGHSLKPIMADATATVRDAAYTMRGPRNHLLRTDRWAYIDYGKDGIELYDMHNDPKQFVNLAKDPQHAATVAELAKQLTAKLDALKR